MKQNGNGSANRRSSAVPVYIPLMTYPDFLKDKLKEISSRLTKEIQINGFSFEKGEIDIGELQGDQKVAYLFLVWLAKTNEIIENLNIVIDDLHTLKDHPQQLKGYRHKRIYLLVRLFFYEFNRFFEVYNDFLDRMVKSKLMSKSVKVLIRNALQDAFKDTVDARNTLLHRVTRWAGEDNVSLTYYGDIIQFREKRGIPVEDKTEIVNSLIEKLSRKYINTLTAKGKKMVKVLNKFIEMCTPPD